MSGQAPGQAALTPSAYAAYEAYAMAAPEDLNFREPDKLDDWEYPSWEAAAQAAYEARAAQEQPAPDLAAVLADRHDLSGLNAWQGAEISRLTAALAALRSGITGLAADLDRSAAETRPSRKSEIESETAIALRRLLETP